MSENNRIMYVCTECATGNPEMCGYYDRTMLRAMPDGRWLCDACFDEEKPTDRCWSDYPSAPEYAEAKP